jgi:(S)-sulfolactate dehydrogenase
MSEIVITEFMDEVAVDDLRRDFNVLYDPDLVDRPDDLHLAVTHCRGLIVRNRTQVREPLLKAASQLEVVGRLGVGLDNIDMDACQARGIPVFPAVGANAVAVAEYVVAGLLMLFRGAYHSNSDMLAGKWPRTQLLGREIGGRRLGLIGFGSIARVVATRAQALGMTVAAYDPHVDADDSIWPTMAVSRLDLVPLLKESDAISLHVPLTDETRHLIDAKALSNMQSQAILINVARGGVVDEQALAVALKNRAIGGAMLDVFESEPLPADAGFDGIPNLILTPHIGGATEESKRYVGMVTAGNERRVLEGK